jgi:TRAP-type uncharacterized transport system substrate-binding protein
MMSVLRVLGFVLLGALLVAVVLGGATFVLRQLDLLPPDSLTIAAGAPGSAYHDAALAYRDILARDDISLRILETRGSVENAADLGKSGDADIALVQGGVSIAGDVSGLAAVFVEPLWVMTGMDTSSNPYDWAGLRIAVGAEGSGTREVSRSLAMFTGASSLQGGSTLELGSVDSARALLDGEIDVALFVAPPEAGYLQPLFASSQLQFLSLAHSEAIAQRLPGARLVEMPAGILEYQRPLPADKVTLVAMVARLVAREDLHPGLVNRLVHAVQEVHQGREIIPANRRYPAATDLGLAANSYATQLFEKGFSPLEKLLPYWIVAQLNRVLLVLLPAILLLLPLLRLLPALYKSMLRHRVLRHYKRVHAIDNLLVSEGERLSARKLRAIRDELDAIELQLLDANLPNEYRKEAYTLLNHLEFVRNRSSEMARQQGAPEN